MVQYDAQRVVVDLVPDQDETSERVVVEIEWSVRLEDRTRRVGVQRGDGGELALFQNDARVSDDEEGSSSVGDDAALTFHAGRPTSTAMSSDTGSTDRGCRASGRGRWPSAEAAVGVDSSCVWVAAPR